VRLFPARAVIVMLVSVCVVVTSSCGYALAGRSSSLPAGIVTIGIPQFVNESTVPEIDRLLTEAVSVEFQSKGRYRVLPEATGVDAVLVGRVVSVILQPSTFTTDNQVQRNLVIATASIEFREVATGRVIWTNPAFQTREEYEVTAGTVAADSSALLRQDANAFDRLSRAFARSVVTSIFEAF
jgi:hypothetical protein